MEVNRAQDPFVTFSLVMYKHVQVGGIFAHVRVLTGRVFLRSQYNVIDTSPSYLPRLAPLFCR